MEILPKMAPRGRENLTLDQVVEKTVAGMMPVAELGETQAQAKARTEAADRLKVIMEADLARAHEAFVTGDLTARAHLLQSADVNLLRASLRATFLQAFRLGFDRGHFHSQLR